LTKYIDLKGEERVGCRERGYDLVFAARHQLLGTAVNLSQVRCCQYKVTATRGEKQGSYT
jgi:hypothetical protein